MTIEELRKLTAPARDLARKAAEAAPIDQLRRATEVIRKPAVARAIDDQLRGRNSLKLAGDWQ